MSERASPSSSIKITAIALLLWSLMILAGGIWYVKSIYGSTGSTRQVLLYWHDASIAIFQLLLIVQIAFGAIGISVSIGLMRLRERARGAAILLCTVELSVTACALVIFAGSGGGHGASSMNAAFGFVVYGCLLVILLPLSILCFVALCRDNARKQFQQPLAKQLANSQAGS